MQNLNILVNSIVKGDTGGADDISKDNEQKGNQPSEFLSINELETM